MGLFLSPPWGQRYIRMIYGRPAQCLNQSVAAWKARVNLRGVSTKLCFDLIFTMQTYKELKPHMVGCYGITRSSISLLRYLQFFKIVLGKIFK